MASTRSSERRCRGALVVAGALLGMAALLGVVSRVSTPQPNEVEEVSVDDSDGGGEHDGQSESLPDEAASSPTGPVGDAGTDAVSRELETLAREQGSEVRVEQSPEEVGAAAQTVLQSYGVQRTCLLASAGYLDVFGRVWGCVVEGPGWVDVCVIEEQTDKTSMVRTVRMRAP